MILLVNHYNIRKRPFLFTRFNLEVAQGQKYEVRKENQGY